MKKVLKWTLVTSALYIAVILVLSSVAAFSTFDLSMFNPANWTRGARMMAALLFWFFVAVGYQCWSEDK